MIELLIYRTTTCDEGLSVCLKDFLVNKNQIDFNVILKLVVVRLLGT